MFNMFINNIQMSLVFIKSRVLSNDKINDDMMIDNEYFIVLTNFTQVINQMFKEINTQSQSIEI